MRHFSVFFLSFCLCFFKYSGIAQTCDQTLWSHVYHSYRLIVNDSCISVTGHVSYLYAEPDGDTHIRLTVDTEYTYMLNADNYSDEYGCLVCEPICVNTITQTDAIAPCAGLTNTVFIPAAGEYVKITGNYVTDNDHGWNEIHPITSIVIIPPAGVQNATVAIPDIKVFPNPANNDINFGLSKKPSSPVYITIADESGRPAGQYQMFEMTNLKINVKYLPTGKYFYGIMQDSRSIAAGSFVIEH